MELFNVLLYRIFLMICYMMIGFFLYRKKLVSKSGSMEFGRLLLYIILPAAIMKSCLADFTAERLCMFLISLIAAIIALSVSVILSQLAFGKRKPIENFSASFSNAGFIGIPLVENLWESEAVFYIASFIALLNILQWTYGVYIMSGSKNSIKPGKIVRNPILISYTIGILLFIQPFKVPELITDVTSGISAMNGPLAMVILGIYLAQLPLKSIFTDRQAYLCCLFRLFLIPCATLLILNFLPEQFHIMKLSILVAAAAPVGSNVAIFAQLENLDYTHAVKNICLSTIISVFTMPCLFFLASIIY